MSVLSILQSQLASCEARLAEIDEIFGRTAGTKSYSTSNATGPSRTMQDIGGLGREYRELQGRQVYLAREIQAEEARTASQSRVAAFQRVD